jgi:hypothetical protein
MIRVVLTVMLVSAVFRRCTVVHRQNQEVKLFRMCFGRERESRMELQVSIDRSIDGIGDIHRSQEN